MPFFGGSRPWAIRFENLSVSNLTFSQNRILSNSVLVKISLSFLNVIRSSIEELELVRKQRFHRTLMHFNQRLQGTSHYHFAQDLYKICRRLDFFQWTSIAMTPAPLGTVFRSGEIQFKADY